MSSDSKEVIYLDNAASTPIHKEVLKEMIENIELDYGNPSSIHGLGRKSKKLIQIARKRMSKLINSNIEEIIFTSGGTEADNLALVGMARKIRFKNPHVNHIITSSIEHDAILECCKYLEQENYEVTYLPVTNDGYIRTEDMTDAIKSNTGLISIMLANNEVGTIQPIETLVKVAKKKNESIIFHSDAVQALGKIVIDVKRLNVDLMSFSSHKINGPKGIGALYIKKGLRPHSLIHGGGQEYTIRSGTENVTGIIGFGKACEMLNNNFEKYNKKISEMKEHLIKKILSEIPNSRLNANSINERVLVNTANFTFFGMNGEDLIIKLDDHGIAVSTGSACSMNKQKQSHVLKAMGFTHDEISGSLRITMGIQNSLDEIDRMVEILKKVILELMELSPYKNNITKEKRYI